MQTLRVGYVPEHFSTPLHLAHTHFALPATLIPEPLGTGALTTRLKHPPDDPRALDLAVGLTEGFISDLGRNPPSAPEEGYKLVGTYVESPLCWGISTGAGRKDANSVGDLKGKKVGVSRVGSGSYVMAFVLAGREGWLKAQGETGTAAAAAPFDVKVIGDFAALRAAVKEGAADFFMWEHFTTKHYWDTPDELKRLGEIYTPWPSWMIAARTSLITDTASESHQLVRTLAERVDEGVRYFEGHREEAVGMIAGSMGYSHEDAEAWMEGVRFKKGVWGVEGGVVEETVKVLREAGVLKGEEGLGGVGKMVAVLREEASG